jgi:hypothetical protein
MRGSPSSPKDMSNSIGNSIFALPQRTTTSVVTFEFRFRTRS